MDILDVVLRLNGPIQPVGDSRVDETRLQNLKSLCNLTGLLLDRITEVAESTDDHMASIKAAKDYAAKFLAADYGLPLHSPDETDAPIHRLRAAVIEWLRTTAGVTGTSPAYEGRCLLDEEPSWQALTKPDYERRKRDEQWEVREVQRG
jgi:hypothetical protein